MKKCKAFYTLNFFSGLAHKNFFSTFTTLTAAEIEHWHLSQRTAVDGSMKLGCHIWSEQL